MPHTIEPSVYLIARTQIDPIEVRRWLTNVGVSEEAIDHLLNPLEDGIKTHAQTLTELAGRR